MKKASAVLLLLVLLAGLMVAPAAAQGSETNLIDECVTEYDPDVDYFPSKAEFEYAEGVEIEYFNNYKVVRVAQAFPGAEDGLEYVLVQCGTPAPDAADFADGAQFIEVPAGDIMSMSTTHMPHLNALGLLDNLVGVDSFLYINTPEVRDMIEAEELVEIGSGTDVNVELVLDAEPSIVMSYSYTEDDAPAVLMDAGIFTAVNNEWLENTLLARTEWIKFTGAFYNMEAEATETFDAIIADYEEVASLTAEIPEDERLTVLWNAYSSWGEAWFIPGQNTWVGELLEAAGVDYVLMEDAPEFSTPMDFETVYDAGLDAPIWVPNEYGVMTIDDLLAMDERYADFAAVESGMVYGDNGRVNENGGNDFYENGVMNPNLILRDLVSIFYPDLLPDHELMFYTQLASAE
jgi:iron complex transport system substrate-binding protein